MFLMFLFGFRVLRFRVQGLGFRVLRYYGYVGVILGLYWDNGNENGNYEGRGPGGSRDDSQSSYSFVGSFCGVVLGYC